MRARPMEQDVSFKRAGAHVSLVRGLVPDSQLRDTELFLLTRSLLTALLQLSAKRN